MSLRDIDGIVAEYGLAPHPFEGWFKETGHVPRERRSLLVLYPAGLFVPWHRIPAACQWRYAGGDPATVSVSTDGRSAAATRINALSPEASVPDGAWQTLETLGRWTLLSLDLRPDVPVSSRELAPEAWAPGRPLRDEGGHG